jgi:hypothetical protein
MRQVRRKVMIQETVSNDEFDQDFNRFLKYQMKQLLGDFNVKVGRENIIKPTIGNESLHQDGNDNAVRIVNVGT